MNFGKIISIILIASNAHAVCEQPTRIKEGTPAPCSGYVFSNEDELKVRTQIAQNEALIENLTRRNSLQEEMLKIDEQQLRLYREQVNSEKTLSTWEKALYFGLGALLTGAVAYGTVQVMK